MTKETFIKELDKILKQETFIEELEKIKAEIRNKRIIDTDFDFETAGWCISLIERHIKELKGDKCTELE